MERAVRALRALALMAGEPPALPVCAMELFCTVLSSKRYYK